MALQMKKIYQTTESIRVWDVLQIGRQRGNKSSCPEANIKGAARLDLINLFYSLGT